MTEALRAGVTTRIPNAGDVDVVVSLLRSMLKDMEAIGHDAVSWEDETWSPVELRVRDTITAADHFFRLAELPSSAVTGLVEARLDQAGTVFAPKRLLHVSALYVVPQHRRHGIGRFLLQQALCWGREQACEEARLNAVSRSPAMKLYTAIGFQDFRVEMRLHLGLGVGPDQP